MLDFIVIPLTNLIIWLYSLTGSFGFSILLLTVMIRVVLIPLSLSSINLQKKMRIVQPKIKELEKKHAASKDKSALRLAQMELYREHKINPLGGLLPSLIQFIPMIAVYQVLQRFLANQDLISQGGNYFLGFDLTQRDGTYILPILAAAFSLVQALMILPGLEQHDLVPEGSKSKKIQQANKKETQSQDSAAAMQKQMVFMMPIMTGVFAIGFPAGLALYWIATTIFGIGQQYFVTGLGGLEPYLAKIGLIKPKKVIEPPSTNQLAAALKQVENAKPKAKTKKAAAKKRQTKKGKK
jgi:YidC/Oxa1 family membrane protein insertase